MCSTLLSVTKKFFSPQSGLETATHTMVYELTLKKKKIVIEKRTRLCPMFVVREICGFQNFKLL